MLYTGILNFRNKLFQSSSGNKLILESSGRETTFLFLGTCGSKEISGFVNTGL